MVIRTLTAADFPDIHAAFVEAFSDYVVPLVPSRDQLEEMLVRRGYAPAASVGAFDEDRLVAFTLNGLDGSRAYDSGTGVVPSHRRQGLARRVMLESFRVLREHGCTSYVLEVIESNQPAAELYRSLEFDVRRELQCWSFESLEASGNAMERGGRIASDQRDVEPSWQNSDAALMRARDRHVILGDENGEAIVFPATAELPQLTVRRDARRRGIGTRLLRAAAAVAGKPLRILNVDENDARIARFLEKAGAKRTVRQREMIREL